MTKIFTHLILLLVISYLYGIALFVGNQVAFFSSQVACGSYFISKRPLESIRKQEGRTDPFGIPLLDNLIFNLIDYSIDKDEQSVEVKFGPSSSKIYFKESYGCTPNNNIVSVTTNPLPNTPLTRRNINQEVQNLIDEEVEKDPGSRALLVFYKNSVSGESYDLFSNAETPLLSWSMTKSLSSVLFSRMYDEGYFELSDKVLPNRADEGSQLTFKHLLNHIDGLDYKESYFPLTDYFAMITSENVGLHLSSLEMTHKPGDYWSYSSAATNLLNYKMTEKASSLGFTPIELYKYYIFEPLGFNNTYFGTDNLGNFIASSFGYVSAESWLKVGIMMMNASKNDESFISKKMFDFMTQPTRLNNNKIIENYGGQWWLNTNNKEISPAFYDLEQKMFSANGFQGQRLFVIPELELIVVRLGLSGGRKEWDNERSFLKSLIDIYE